MTLFKLNKYKVKFREQFSTFFFPQSKTFHRYFDVTCYYAYIEG